MTDLNTSTFSMEQMAINAKLASRAAAQLNTTEKNILLNAIADAITANSSEIISENKKDIEIIRIVKESKNNKNFTVSTLLNISLILFSGIPIPLSATLNTIEFSVLLVVIFITEVL
mgnify:CR=1 FL=1